VARIFNAEQGGSSVIDLPTSGGPITDVEFNPLNPASLEVAALSLDGTIQIWRDAAAWSELPHIWTGLLSPYIEATPDGAFYVVGGNDFIPGLTLGCAGVDPFVSVIDASTDTVLAAHETICTLGRSHRAAITDDGRLAVGSAKSGNVFVLHPRLLTRLHRCLRGWRKRGGVRHDRQPEDHRRRHGRRAPSPASRRPRTHRCPVLA
jgi:WD40 repeat protein